MRIEQQSKNALRAAFRGWGLATAGQRVLPTAMIVGAQRAGTTALFRALIAQPGVLGPTRWKGVHYFDVQYTQSLSWYRAHFPTKSTSKIRAYRSSIKTPAVIEASPYYMFHPQVPARIAHDLGPVKAIVLLRDPVERAYSAWEHEHARGFEHLGFADAVAAEDDRLSGEVERIQADPMYVSHAHRHQAYVSRGIYVDQLRRLEIALGRRNLLVLDSERYFAEPDSGLTDALRFLGLPNNARHPTVFTNSRTGRGALPASAASVLRRRFKSADHALVEWLGWVPPWVERARRACDYE